MDSLQVGRQGPTQLVVRIGKPNLLVINRSEAKLLKEGSNSELLQFSSFR